MAQVTQRPASGYLEARLRTGVDAGHTKAGSEFQAEALAPWKIGDCSISQKAKIYGRIVSATRHSKSSPESTLGLHIESVDCDGHRRTPIPLHVLGVVVPDSPPDPLSGAIPRDPHGDGSISAGTAANAMRNEHAEQGEEMSSFHPGTVVGANWIRLEIANGPDFADALFSGKRNVSLPAGARLVLGTKDMIPADLLLRFHPVEQ